MRTFLLSMIIIMTSFAAVGQKKSGKENKDAQIDSLTKVNQALALQVDSINGELVKYLGLYNTIKDKVLHYDFDPTRSAFLIDSLQARRDTALVLAGQSPQSQAYINEVLLLKNENIKLKACNDSLKIVADENLRVLSEAELEKAKAIGDLKQLKELLDTKIITETEFVTLKAKYLKKL